MMTVTENSLSQTIDYPNYAINRPYPLTYENPWEKSSPYPVYSHQSSISFDANFYPHQNYPFNWNNLSYPSFYNTLPPTNYSVLPPPPLPPLPSHTVLQCQRAAQSIPVKKPKRPRLTARIRSEIIKIKSSKPSIFIWEIQQNLIKTGVCTSQTVPNTATIQRVLNQSIKPEIALPSPTHSTSESQSECSICLEYYRSGQEVSILACSHEYHSSCIAQWMIKNRSCPMCRKDIHNQPQFVTLLI